MQPFTPGPQHLAKVQQAGPMPAEALPSWDDSQDDLQTIAQNRRRWLLGACERARRWVLAMQNRDGGWGAFDKDNDSEFLCRVPFADHNAMIDPSTPDLTGRVLEALALWGGKRGQLPVEKAIRYLRAAPVVAYVSASGRPSIARQIAATHLPGGQQPRLAPGRLELDRAAPLRLLLGQVMQERPPGATLPPAWL